MSDDLKRYLKYVRNTAGNASVSDFDEDWEPIGPRLREVLMPHYVVEVGGKLQLTGAGNEMLGDA